MKTIKKILFITVTAVIFLFTNNCFAGHFDDLKRGDHKQNHRGGREQSKHFGKKDKRSSKQRRTKKLKSGDIANCTTFKPGKAGFQTMPR